MDEPAQFLAMLRKRVLAERSHTPNDRANLNSSLRTADKSIADAEGELRQAQGYTFKDFVREAKKALVEAKEAKAQLSSALAAYDLSEIDGVLEATLGVDDYIDLDAMKMQVKHAAFKSEYEDRIPPPEPIAPPPEPVFAPPPAPRGVGAMFGGKKKYAQQHADAVNEFESRRTAWQEAAANAPTQQLAQLTKHKEAENARLASLAQAREAYDRDCESRKQRAEWFNTSLNDFSRELKTGQQHAIEFYFGLVFENSSYPSFFPWPPTCAYDPMTRELEIQLPLPRPDQIPTIKLVKYVRARDAFVDVESTQKEQRDRYSNLVYSMTLRTLHEVWEADRLNLVRTVSLTAYVQHTDPATGNETLSNLVGIAALKEDFMQLRLENITPLETLNHLHATLSKSPFTLQPIGAVPGVRGH